MYRILNFFRWDRFELIPFFPERVHLSNTGIFDEAIDFETKLNSSAMTIFQYINNKNTISDIIGTACNKYSYERDIIEKDVWSLVTLANKRNLLNFRISTNNVLRKVQGLIYCKFFKRFNKRYDVKGFAIWEIMRQVISVVGRNFFTIGGFITALIVFLTFIEMIFLGKEYIHFSLIFLMGVYCFLIGCIASFSIHETMHIYYYRKYSGTQGGYFIAYNLSYSFKRRVFNNYWIILSGIIIPVIIGLILLVIPCFAKFNIGVNIGFGSFTAPFVLQLLNFLPFNGDGKAILQLLFHK